MENADGVYHTETLPKASICYEVPAKEEGYVSHIACDEIGICSLILGGGRETKESEIDLAVGLVLKAKVGDFVKKGDTLATIYANSQEKLDNAVERFYKAYRFSESKIEKRPLIRRIVTE